MAKRRHRTGHLEAIYTARLIGSAPEPPDTAERRSRSLMSRAAINVAAKAVSEAERIPEPIMLDTILRDYWRMKRPHKADLLREYRRRCSTILSNDWLSHHCQMAAFLESLLPESDAREGS